MNNNTKICLYLKGTDKVYKKFDSERKANEFLNLWEMYGEKEVQLELGECDDKTRLLWSYPIHWEIINGIHLNNFEAYEHLLFMEDERKLPDRWMKFARTDVFCDGEYTTGVYMPFDKPQTCHEYHLNHFVYWMVIGHLRLIAKPTAFFDYNTGKTFKPPINYCWACAYDRVIGMTARERKGLNWYSCNCCPIWEKGEYQCENDSESPYHLYSYGFDRSENAIKLAKMPWRDLDEMVDHILY